MLTALTPAKVYVDRAISDIEWRSVRAACANVELIHGAEFGGTVSANDRHVRA